MSKFSRILLLLLLGGFTVSAQIGQIPGGAVPAPAVQYIYHATTTLTNAQIKQLPLTGITVVAAPGANLLVVPVRVVYSGSAAAGAYTNVGDKDYINLYYGQFQDQAAQPIIAVMLETTTPFVGVSGAFATEFGLDGDEIPTIFSAAVGVVNKEVTVGMGSISGLALGGGHASNTITVTVYYMLVSTA